jgi:hypothetical protein
MKVKQEILYFVCFLAPTILFVAAELFLTLYVLFGIGSVGDLNFTSTQRVDIPGERPISQHVPSQTSTFSTSTISTSALQVHS